MQSLQLEASLRRIALQHLTEIKNFETTPNQQITHHHLDDPKHRKEGREPVEADTVVWNAHS